MQASVKIGGVSGPVLQHISQVRIDGLTSCKIHNTRLGSLPLASFGCFARFKVGWPNREVKGNSDTLLAGITQHVAALILQVESIAEFITQASGHVTSYFVGLLAQSRLVGGIARALERQRCFSQRGIKRSNEERVVHIHARRDPKVEGVFVHAASLLN